MTQEVAELVLYNNFKQNIAISLGKLALKDYLSFAIRFIEYEDSLGNINKALEFLPSKKEILERKSLDLSLTRPEISILLAYSNIILRKDILQHTLSDEILLNYAVSISRLSEKI